MNLSKATTAELAAELTRREKGAAKLQARREKLLAELAEIESELGPLAGDRPATAGKGSRGPRPKNAVSLEQALADAAEVGAQITPKEAAEIVQGNGYVSNSATFMQQVATRLAQHSGFKRVERGVYERVE